MDFDKAKWVVTDMDYIGAYPTATLELIIADHDEARTFLKTMKVDGNALQRKVYKTTGDLYIEGYLGELFYEVWPSRTEFRITVTVMAQYLPAWALEPDPDVRATLRLLHEGE